MIPITCPKKFHNFANVAKKVKQSKIFCLERNDFNNALLLCG